MCRRAAARSDSPSPFTLLGRDELLCVLDQLPRTQAERRPLLQVLGLHAAALPPGVFRELYPQLSFELTCTSFIHQIEHSELSVTYVPQTDTWSLVQWVVRARTSDLQTDHVEGIVIDFDDRSRSFKDPKCEYVLHLSKMAASCGYSVLLSKREPVQDNPGYWVDVDHPLVHMWRATTTARRQRTTSTTA